MARLGKLRKRGYGEKLGTGWRCAYAVLYYPVSGLFKVRYRHIDRVPQDGAVIFVANHVSHVDPFLLSKFVLDAARTPRFLAKDSIFEVPVVGWGMRAMGHIPVKRGTTDAVQSLQAAVEALQSGRAIVLHPEGTVTRDPDGWPMSGRTGVARLVTLVPGVPVVPLAQWGVQEQFDLYHKRVKLIPRPRHVISVGEPVDLSAFDGQSATPAVLKAITDTIMRRLRHDVADLRGLPEPTGALFVWRRSADRKRSERADAGESKGDAA